MNEVLTEESVAISSGAGLTVLTGTENSMQTENSSKDVLVNSNDFTESVSSTNNSKESVDAAVGVIRSLPEAKKVTLGDQILPFESSSSTNLPNATKSHRPEQPNYNTKVDTVITQPLPVLVFSSTDLPEVIRDPLVEQPKINTNIDTSIDQVHQLTNHHPTCHLLPIFQK